jgi:hypothetical protein
LTDFVVQPAGFRLLIPFSCRTLPFRASHARTGQTVPVATIAMAADDHATMTTFAVENPAV